MTENATRRKLLQQRKEASFGDKSVLEIVVANVFEYGSSYCTKSSRVQTPMDST